ncbi:MAG: fibronectin type III domain-containing protein [Myxococcota bacterium]
MLPRAASADDGPNWAVAAHRSLFIGDGSLIIGDVAAQDATAAPCLADNAAVTLGTGTTVYGSVWGDAVSLRGTPAVNGTVYYSTSLSPAPSTFPPGATDDALTLPVVLVDFEAPDFPPETGEAPITVGAGTEVELDWGLYQSITLEAGTEETPTVLRLIGENYAIGSLTIGDHARVEFGHAASVLIETRLTAGAYSSIGASWDYGVLAQDTVVLVLGENGTTGALGDDPPSVSFGASGTLNTQIWAPNGTIRMGSSAFARGRVIGKWTEIGAVAVLTLPGAGCGFGRLPAEAECDDGDPCTDDDCLATGQCSHEPSASCGTVSAVAFYSNAYVSFGPESTAVELAWTAAEPESAVSHYEIRQDDVLIAVVVSPARSWRATGLSPTGTYAFEVTAVDLAGVPSEPLAPQPFAMADTNPPVWPLPALTIHPHSTSADLDWPPAWDDVGIQRYHVVVDGEPVTGAGISATSFHLDGLTLGESYSVSVSVEDTAGNIQETALSGTIWTMDADRPTWSGSAQISGVVGTNDLELTWSGAEDDVAVLAYFVVVYEDGFIADSAWVAEPVTFPYAFPVDAATDYGVLVFACDGYTLDACSAESLKLSLGGLTSDTDPPTWPDPSSISVTATGLRWLDLAWPDASDPSGIKKYLIYTGANPVPAECILATGQGCQRLLGLRSATTYDLQIEAVDWWDNESNDGPTLSATTAASTAAWVGSPALTATPLSDTELRLEWTAADSTEGSCAYEVTVTPTDPTGPVSFWRYFGQTSPYATVPDLTPGSTYAVQVILHDNQGYPTAEILTATVTMPTSPLGVGWSWPSTAWLTAERGDPATDVIVRWSPLTLSARYAFQLEVTRDDDDDATVLSAQYPVNQTSAVLSALMPLSPHTVHLRVIDTFTAATSPTELTASLAALSVHGIPPDWPVADFLTAGRGDPATDIHAEWGALALPAGVAYELQVLRADESDSPLFATLAPAGSDSVTLTVPEIVSGSPYTVYLQLRDTTTGATSLNKLVASAGRDWPVEPHLNRHAAIAAAVEQEWTARLAALGTGPAADAAREALRLRCRAMGLRGDRPGFTTDGRGYFTSIRGCDLRLATNAPTGSDAETIARAFLAENAQLFGIDPADIGTRVTFPLAGIVKDRDGADRVHFLEEIDGAPVFTASLTVLVRDERVARVGASLTPPAALDSNTSSISAPTAAALAAGIVQADVADGVESIAGIFDPVALGRAAQLAVPTWRIRVLGRIEQPDVYIGRADGRAHQVDPRASNLTWPDLSPEARHIEAYSQVVAPRATALESAPAPSECEDATVYPVAEEVEFNPVAPWIGPEMLQYSTLIESAQNAEDRCEFAQSGSGHAYTYCASATGEPVSCEVAVDCRASSCSATGEVLRVALDHVGAFYYEWTGQVGWDNDPMSSEHRLRALTDFGEVESCPLSSACPDGPGDPPPDCCYDPLTQCTIHPAFASGDGGASPGRWFEQGKLVVISANLLTPDRDDAFQYTLAHELCHGIEHGAAIAKGFEEIPEISHRWVHEGVGDIMGVMRQAYAREPVCGGVPEWYLGYKCGPDPGLDPCPCPEFGDMLPQGFAERAPSQVIDPMASESDPPIYMPMHLSETVRTPDLADNSRIITKLGQLLGDLAIPAAPHHGITVPRLDALPWSYRDLTRLFLDSLVQLDARTLTAFRSGLIDAAHTLTDLPVCDVSCSPEPTCGAGAACAPETTCALGPTCETDGACAEAPACDPSASPPDNTECQTAEAKAAAGQIISAVRAASDAIGLWTEDTQLGTDLEGPWVPSGSDLVSARTGARRWLLWLSPSGTLRYRWRDCAWDDDSPACPPAAEDDLPAGSDFVTLAAAGGAADATHPEQLFFAIGRPISGGTDTEFVICWIGHDGSMHELELPSSSNGVHLSMDSMTAMAVQGGFLYLFYTDLEAEPAGALRVARIERPVTFPHPEQWELVEGVPDLVPITGLSVASVPSDVVDAELLGHITVAFGADLLGGGEPPVVAAASALTVWDFDPASPSAASVSHWQARSYDSEECLTPSITGRPLVAWFRGMLHMTAQTDILAPVDAGNGSPSTPDPGIVYVRSHPPDHLPICVEEGAIFSAWTTPWKIESGSTEHPAALVTEDAGAGIDQARLILWSFPDSTGSVRPTLRSKSSD